MVWNRHKALSKSKVSFFLFLNSKSIFSSILIRNKKILIAQTAHMKQIKLNYCPYQSPRSGDAILRQSEEIFNKGTWGERAPPLAKANLTIKLKLNCVFSKERYEEWNYLD